MRDALYHTAVSASLVPLSEEKALLPGENINARPADVMLPHYNSGWHLTFGVCVVYILQAQLVDGAADEPGHALQHRYTEKWRKYGEACQAEGVVFQPLPFEVLGISMTQQQGSSRGLFM